MWEASAAGYPGGCEKSVERKHVLSEETCKCLFCLICFSGLGTAKLYLLVESKHRIINLILMLFQEEKIIGQL